MSNTTNNPWKGYPVSTDYAKLWRWVQLGYEVPCWVHYDNHWTIARARWPDKSTYPMIGSKGMAYEPMSDSFDEFATTCEAFNIHFIPPTQ